MAGKKGVQEKRKQGKAEARDGQAKARNAEEELKPEEITPEIVPQPEEAPPVQPEENPPAQSGSPAPPAPVQPAPVAPAQAAPFVPAFELLPSWENPRRLKSVVDEAGLAVIRPEAGSKDYKEAMRLLRQKDGAAAVPGRFLVCVKDRPGAIAAAAEACATTQEGATVLVLLRSSVFSGNRRDMHLLLYAAALAVAKPAHVVCACPHPDLSKPEDAGRLIFFGRGMALCAVPLNHPKLLLFLRSVGKEHDSGIPGPQLAAIANAANVAYKDRLLPGLAASLGKSQSVRLVMLPISPDYGEHLHELKDAVVALGLPAGALEKSLSALESKYVRSRADLTPASLF
jgi:hypothetical protein